MASEKTGDSRHSRQPARPAQQELRFPGSWGGKRKGAGRKPAGRRAGVAHRSRDVDVRCPLHVTLRVREQVWNLRSVRSYRVLRRAFENGRDRFGFRLVHYSVQGNHLHLLVEAPDGRALHRGMTGLTVRMARGLNHLMGRSGPVFADRYHARMLRTPAEVAVTRRYVLRNAHGHAARRGERLPSGWVDEYSSAALHPRWGPPPVVPAATWLLRTGWQRAGPG